MTTSKTAPLDPPPPVQKLGTRTSRPSDAGVPRFNDLCPAGYVTRAMLLEQTGLTDAELKRYEQRGLLKIAALNNKRWGLYLEDTIETLRRLAVERPTRLGSVRRSAQEVTYTSREARDVFVALRAGSSLEQIIIEQGLHPSIVQVIAKDYQYVAGAILLAKSVVDEINAMPFDGPRPVRDGDDVLAVMREATRVRACGSCGQRRPSSLCGPCTRDRLAAAERASTVSPSPIDSREPSTEEP